MELKLVYERAWAFHNTTGINFDDLVDEATMAYVEGMCVFDNSYGVKETTFVYKIITNKLIDYCRRMKLEKTIHFDNIAEAAEFSFEPNFDRVLDKKPILDAFQPHIRELIQIILDNAELFNNESKRNRNRGVLKEILRQKGWEHSKIQLSFMQIKSILRKVPISQLFAW